MPVNIKGKEYVTVAERMELLRQSGKQFEMVESKAIALGDRVAWQVSLMIGDRLFIGSAEAHLNAKPGSADATDPFACAETSAIGRALGLAGFGSLDAIASADEIVRTQEPAQPTSIVHAPVPSKLRKMFESINTTLETAQKMTFKQIFPDDNLTPEQCFQLRQVYDAWKKRYDERPAKTA
jgi:hypothetical protein